MPAVQHAVFAVDQHRARDRVDRRGVDAPFLDAARRTGGIRGRAQLREHFLHHGDARRDRVRLRLITRVEDRDPVLAVAGACVGVVVVIGEQQVVRRPRVLRHHRCGHDRRRVVPAERARRARLGQRGVEVQQPAAVVVARHVGFEHADVDVAVGADQRRRRGVVADPGRTAGGRVVEHHLGLQRQCGGIERHQAPGGAAIDGRCRVEHHVQRAVVDRQRRRAVGHRLGQTRVAGGRGGGDERARAVGADARHAATGRPPLHDVDDGEAKEDVAGGIAGERRVDEHGGVIGRLGGQVGRVAAVEDEVVHRGGGVGGVGVVAHLHAAADQRHHHAARRRQHRVEARSPAVRRRDVVAGQLPEQVAGGADAALHAKRGGADPQRHEHRVVPRDHR